jgi:hypothetical protein
MASPAQEIRSIWPYQQQADIGPIAPVFSSSRGTPAQRGIGLRERTELSATGIVIERGRELSEREQRSLFKLELFLPEQSHPVRVLAKVARRAGSSSYALKFVLISDVDRLTLMEHLDLQQRDSLELLRDLEHSAA